MRFAIFCKSRTKFGGMNVSLMALIVSAWRFINANGVSDSASRSKDLIPQ